MPPKYRITQCTLIFILALVTGCKRADPNVARLPPNPTSVTITIAEYRPVTTHYTVAGTLEAPRRIEIYNQIEGRLLLLPFHEGDIVRKGDELVRLDDQLVRAELAKAIAKTRQAELDLSRQLSLLKRNAASQDEVAQARTALELAQAEERIQRTLVARVTISAPFPGVISERLKEPGDVVALHTHILSLLDPGRLIVNAHVSEFQLTRLQAGDVVSVRIDALPERDFEGRILRTHPTIDPDTRQGMVEVELKPVPEGALPGQLARVTFTFDEGRRMTVPFTSVQYDRTGPYVYRVDKQETAQRVRVSLGRQFVNSTEVRSGIADGDRVVLSGFVDIQDGKPVQVIHANQQVPDIDPPAENRS